MTIPTDSLSQRPDLMNELKRISRPRYKWIANTALAEAESLQIRAKIYERTIATLHRDRWGWIGVGLGLGVVIGVLLHALWIVR